MFRRWRSPRTPPSRFPRIRGDVPCLPVSASVAHRFSPHTRGCSARLKPVIVASSVFPAYAGMFRPVGKLRWLALCFPRIRGDVPQAWSGPAENSLFSPHTRGCSGFPRCHLRGLRVFPAYAGMFLRLIRRYHCPDCFPRIRGDVPAALLGTPNRQKFSPHTRGCSHAR